MRSTAPSRTTNLQNHPQNRSQLSLRPCSPRCNKQCNLDAALQVLDNSHGLWLLESTAGLGARELCLRVRLAHASTEHGSCFQFSCESLVATPACLACLDVYIAHEQETSLQGSFRPTLVSALTQLATPLAVECLLRLAEAGRGVVEYRQLMAELKRQRAKLDKFEVLQVQANQRKVIAKGHIRRDELILFVPRHKLITLELARTLPLVDRLYGMRLHLKSPKHTQLAVYLLQEMEKGLQSEFYAYLSTLPNNFQRFPINYLPSLLQELDGTCFLELVETKKKELRKDYEVVCGFEPSFARFSFEKFVQARLLVCSRVFGVVIDRVKTDALVPLADMLNHHMPKQTSWYYCDYSKGFVIQSLKEIAPGAQIFDSYGQKCNSRFLLHYGFTLPDNPHNQVTLTITSASHRSSSTRLRVSRIIESKPFDDMMGVLRVAANSQRLLQSQGQQVDLLQNAKQTPFTSIDQEVRAWQLLESIIVDRFQDYPTTLVQDRRLLERAEGNLRDVITLRMGEKEVLHYYLVMARKIVKSLGSHNKRGELAAYEAYLSGLQLEGRTEE